MAENGTPRRPSIRKVAEFIARVGPGGTFTKLELFDAVPDVAQADRRMRDLREMGWRIDNYKVNPNLRPNQYLVVQLGVRIDLGEPVPKGARKAITGPKRRRIFERDGHTCQVCGIHAGAAFPDDPERHANLTVGHVIPVSRGGSNDDDNLRAECQRCGDEARDITRNPPTKEEVLAHLSHLGGLKEKRRLYGWMQAGTRTLDDTERLFIEWARLSPVDRLAVTAALADQVIKDLARE
ncbi:MULTISPECIES: HNH endonuclease [unclassified Streptomyces]|uniref:HNH endonuclease n=1 Tax=unclassified Streptomyces TaxID=2593676 RepID=UPI0022B6CA7E|nr:MULTISPECIES: HNH endonuclease signature motif containing protein [unclassified Streptomyces]MCZ7417511.1 HNH endonuclease signature motif containing protein [Streptomyces sp. WMMC897]MCZ7432660.1 HNH endonuclease signature motif containing protein [Streptomyces sp. WMMC1477]